jgi:hypothetical protein
MPGMTWQGDLDHFWHNADGPDVALYYAFLDYVVHHTQINGDFYTRTGMAMATAGAVSRLEATTGAMSRLEATVGAVSRLETTAGAVTRLEATTDG